MPGAVDAAAELPGDSLGRRLALRGLALLLLAPLLAGCKDVEQGSGIQTIRRQKEQQPGGR
jgi:hypothetical protein